MIFEANDDGSITFDDQYFTQYPKDIFDVNIQFSLRGDEHRGHAVRSDVKGVVCRREGKKAVVYEIASWDEDRRAYTAVRRRT